MAKIREIKAEEINDSRGNPTLRVTVYSDNSEGSFEVPSGASTGIHEARELRDQDGGMMAAIEVIHNTIMPALVGIDIRDQTMIDQTMIDLDGSSNKKNLGGNSMIGVSIAAAKAAAAAEGIELYEYLRTLREIKPSQSAPYLFINLLNGGKHAEGGASFQEFQIIPKTDNLEKAYNIGVDVQNILRDNLGKEINIGDEGGFVPKRMTTEEMFEMLKDSIKSFGDVVLSTDVAASSFYEKGIYTIDGNHLLDDNLHGYYRMLLDHLPIEAIEDPFNEEDFENFARLNEKDVLVIGDDLTTTNKDRLEVAIENKSIGGIIIKPNQIGTLTETLDTMERAREEDIHCIVSHRSGETMDNFIADLAYAFGCYGIKAGAPDMDVRAVKYKRLIKIQQNENI